VIGLIQPTVEFDTVDDFLTLALLGGFQVVRLHGCPFGFSGG
jgi:hypothetical protein